jgi:RNA recognition motif-containing protein
LDSIFVRFVPTHYLVKSLFMNIYVGNMNFNLGNDELTNLFSQFGTVTSAKIIIDKVTGRSKGFGFVEMTNDDEARSAIAGLHETEVMGRKLIVNEAKPQEPRPQGGGFNRRPQGGGGGYRGNSYGNRSNFDNE